MKVGKRNLLSMARYLLVIFIAVLGFFAVIGTGGGGGDDGGNGGGNDQSIVGSYSAKGDYDFIPSASETDIYEEIYFDVVNTDFPAGWGFQQNEVTYYENQYYPDDNGTDQLWLIGEEGSDYFIFYRVGERTASALQIVGTWKGTDDYGDICTLTLGEPNYMYSDTWGLYYYFGPYTISVSYTEEGEEEVILPPPAHDPR